MRFCPSALCPSALYRSARPLSSGVADVHLADGYVLADAESLIQLGAFKQRDSSAELCAAPNVHLEQLENYARLAVSAFVPELASLALVRAHRRSPPSSIAARLRPPSPLASLLHR